MPDLFDLNAADSDTGAFRMHIPLDPHSSKIVRERLLAYAARHGVDAPVLDDFVFAVGEALANAIEHSNSTTAIEVRCSVDHEKILAIVSDTGCGFAYSGPSYPPPGLAERGRGLPIMQGFTDIFSLSSTPGEGTAVMLGRYTGARPKESPKAS
jgi:anti-sigma regulatory factor (Ser/Thr protein kinase)